MDKNFLSGQFAYHWLKPMLSVGTYAALLFLLTSNGRSAAQPMSAPAQTPPPYEDIVQQFKAMDFYYTGGRFKNERFSYRLYIPEQLDTGKKYPLLLWFHGAGQSGRDNWLSLMHLDRGIRQFNEKYGPVPAFILVPQARSRDVGWFNSPATDDDMISIAWSLLQQTIHDYPIDEDRIVLSGVSTGGNSCWELASRHPEQFAAIAPIASAGCDDRQAIKLVNLQVWVFHNLDDDVFPIEGDRRTIAAIRDAGGRARLTKIDQSGHSGWTQAFQDYRLLEWLIRRDRRESHFWFYLYSDNWWLVAIRFGLPLLAVIACFLEFRRRRLSNRRNTSSFTSERLPDFPQLLADEDNVNRGKQPAAPS
jgi:predicted peptidase